ncbi:type IV toxin-antitoxin system AbiEi family antitoxin domain-containing protein [Pengzhenrongella sp.]|uniref:type IV toxin-antitoxin system AbiEi family antitoxin domain-containing protein n=1 Tax=Pengzhenrongella sp. TaxID=2888820 RepID=UPI002F93094C
MLAEVTAYQWGMVTSAQASMHGITRLDLSRLAETGHVKRLAHGVYMDAGAPGDQFDDLRAAWLSTDPKKLGEERIKDRANGVVVAGASAARLHDIGDLWSDRHEFVSPTRRQTQRPEIHYRQRVLDPHDVTLVEGLPAMTMERTICDLVGEVGDLSLVADALRDASLKRNLDVGRLRTLLAPLADRNGFTKSDGPALLSRLLEIAGIDPDTVARRIAADTSLGSRVAAKYFGNLSKADLSRLMLTPEMQKALHSMQESVAATLQDALSPQVAGLNATMESVRATLIKSAGFDEIAKRISAQFATSDAMKELSRAWGKSLGDSIALKPETLAAIREAQRAVADD